MFEAFKSLNKSWGDRVLEHQSLRSIFCWVVVAVFILSADIALAAYEIFRLHRFNWLLFVGNILILGPLVIRGALLIYRRLGR
jgi:hypothetical protein